MAWEYADEDKWGHSRLTNWIIASGQWQWLVKSRGVHIFKDFAKELDVLRSISFERKSVRISSLYFVLTTRIHRLLVRTFHTAHCRHCTHEKPNQKAPRSRRSALFATVLALVLLISRQLSHYTIAIYPRPAECGYMTSSKVSTF